MEEEDPPPRLKPSNTLDFSVASIVRRRRNCGVTELRSQDGEKVPESKRRFRIKS